MNEHQFNAFQFLMSEREFGINLIGGWGFRRVEAEDILGELGLAWMRNPDSIPNDLTRGILVRCLRQKKEDFRRRRDAVKRGGNFSHVSDEVLDGVAAESLDPGDDRLPALVMRLKRRKATATGRILILLQVMIRGLIEGTSHKAWPDEFTDEEKLAFIGERKVMSDQGFRKAVARNLSELLKELRDESGLN